MNNRVLARSVAPSWSLWDLGSIGAEVASMAAALRMHVIGVREHPERGGGSPGSSRF